MELKEPVFHGMGLFKGESYPVSERAARRGFYLPSGLNLTEVQAEKVADSLKKILS